LTAILARGTTIATLIQPPSPDLSKSLSPGSLHGESTAATSSQSLNTLNDQPESSSRGSLLVLTEPEQLSSGPITTIDTVIGLPTVYLNRYQSYCLTLDVHGNRVHDSIV
jgi:hypothetical protein